MVLDIPEKAKVAGIMLELGMMRMRHIIRKAQMIYVSQVLWEMDGTITNAALVEEWRINGENSIVAKADKIALEYGMHKISEMPVDKKNVKRIVRQANDAELWEECFMSPVVVSRPYIKVKDKSFYGWPKSRSQALLLWRVGALKTKTAWRLYNVARGVGVSCVWPMCEGEDDFEHIKVCKFYQNRWNSKCCTEEELAKFIVNINRERVTKFKMPIL